MQGQISMSTGIIRMLQDCAAMCCETWDILLNRSDVTMRKFQIKLLSDCASVCELCAKFIAENSVLIKSLCDYCAFVCEYCAKECLKHNERESQMCGQMCLNCARDCRAFTLKH